MTARAACTALLLLASLSACDRPRDTGMSREQFVRVNVALRLLPDSAPNLQAQRDSILRRERVTARQLERWVSAHANEGTVLMETWREISTRVDSARPRIPSGQPRPGGSPPGPEPQVPMAAPPAGDVPPPPRVGGPEEEIIRRGRERLRARQAARDSARAAGDSVRR